MKQSFFITLCFLCIPCIQAQNYTRESGKVTQYEADMTSYDKDPDAEAVILYETGKAYFQGDDASHQFLLHIDKSIKIKILKQAGLKYGEIEIPIYESENKIESLWIKEAITYNVDNGILVKTPLDIKTVYEEKMNKNWHVKKFAMPNVKEGSIIEIEYQIKSPFYFNLREWEFQHRIPVVYSCFELRMIPYYEYVYIAKGFSRFNEFSNQLLNSEVRWGNLLYKEMQYKMGLKDIPAFKDEDFISSENDYRMILNFQLSKIHYPQGGQSEIMTTWPKMCNDFLKDEDFGKYINSAEKEAKNILPLLALDGKTPGEKIKIIANYVKFNYNWNGSFDKFARKKVSQTIKEKTGNSAELNLLMLGLLTKAGIEAKPVLLSTRAHGIVDVSYPFQQFLNYVIVKATDGDKDLFLDATESMLLYNELPERCLGIRGLVVEKNSEEWVEITQDDRALTEKHFEIRCQDDLSSVEAKVTYTAYDYDAFNYRKTYYGDEQNLKNFLSKNGVTIVENMDVQSYNDAEQPFVFSFDTQATINKTSDKLFIAPFLNQAPRENIFKQDQRTLPVDMIYRHAGTYISTIEIPAGYKVETLPPEKNYNNKTNTIQYKAEQKGNTIEITAHYEFKKSIYEAKEYPVLKVSYSEIIKLFNEMIVLSKIEIK
jgi:hypothetical protein